MHDKDVAGMDGDEAQGSALSVRTYECEGRLVVEATGEVTTDSADRLAQALRPPAGAAGLPLTVDLRRVDFLDSVGLCVLVDVSKRLRSKAVPLAPRVLVTPQGQPARVLKLGAFGRILEIDSGHQ